MTPYIFYTLKIYINLDIVLNEREYVFSGSTDSFSTCWVQNEKSY